MELPSAAAPDAERLEAQVRELRCLVHASSLIGDRELALEAVAERLLHLLPSGYTWPDIAQVRVRIGERSWETPEFRVTPWVQTAVVKSSAGLLGDLQVCYRESRPEKAVGPFREEERELLDAISELLAQRIDRHRAVETLRANEELLEMVLGSVPTMLWAVDRQGIVTFARGTLPPGLAPGGGPIAGSPVGGLLADRPEVASLLDAAFAGHPVSADVPWGDRVFDARFSPVLEGGGSVRSVTGVLTDVTERVHAERELRRSTELLEELFMGLSFLIAYLDRDLVYVRVNRAYAKAFGATVAAFPGRSVADFPTDAALAAILRRVAAEGVYVAESEKPLCFPATGAAVTYWDVDAIPLGSVAAPSTGLVVVLVDRTARWRALRELERLASHLEDLREEERRTIAREVHDEIGGLLTALRMELSLLHDVPGADGSGAPLDRVRRLLDDGIALTRRIATNLRPLVLDELGIVAAAQWLVDGFRRRAKMRCDLQLPDGDLPLGPEVATAVFRVLQEALTNVARHARASRVRISLAAEADEVVLVVEDNGRGISPGEADGIGTYGLLGMRERVARFGGTLTIAGTAGRGTRLSVRIPPRRVAS